ncbi:urate hydroxylase PuuD [Ferrovibrio sp.]|uniref:urate hydroxylase PuuD n=1 Tax=Ferrovibrio sp. TaxID=1917215 RepID=UPI00261C0BEE|nr:urate hydroxylase PuuD [Ferrovibrio sp.]
MIDLALEWLNLVLRWMHLIFGIAWIGSSFFFVWLDNSLRKGLDQQPGVLGQAWLIHGGGFYFTEKYSVAPPQLPAELHWFKYEAYFTWLSGFFLLGVLYYVGADLYLIDAKVLPMERWQAIGLSLASLVLGWVVYDLLCKSPLGKNDAALAVVGFVLLVAAAWGYTQVFSARAAYLHVGALIGTIMTANVAHNIIPNQRKAVAQMLAGQVPDPSYGKQAKQRSLHNNYLTLPVLFAMISNHYPVTYGHPYGWVILAVVMIIGGLVRHFFNLKNQGRGQRYEFLGLAFALTVGLVFFSQWDPRRQQLAGDVTLEDVQRVVAARCVACHAARPTFDGIAEAPKGVMLETPEQMRRFAALINQQAVRSEAMPPGNATEITDEERAMLGAWIAAGAKLD